MNRNSQSFNLFLDKKHVLLPPSRPSTSLPEWIEPKIAVCFATRFEKRLELVREYFSMDKVKQWARVRRLEGGDDMHAAGLSVESEDQRDATFIWVRVFRSTFL